MQQMNLTDQLKTLKCEDTRIKANDFEKLDKMSSGMTEEKMIHMMHNMNNLRSSVKKLTAIVLDRDEQ